MKKIFPLLGLMVICLTTIAQEKIEGCGNTYYLKQRAKENPYYLEGIQRAENAAQAWIKKNGKNFKSNDDAVVTIPVVFHVVYNKEEQNIPDERLISQIQVLNEDFLRMNEDKVNTRPIFDTIAANTKIIFQLATVDPDGNPTTGITRTETEKTSFDLLPFGGSMGEINHIKHDSTGGKSAWNTQKYLNLWVGNLTVFGGEGLYGIATFPRNAPPEEIEGQEPEPENEQGAILFYKSTGRYHDGNGNMIGLGRTAPHEVGHFLGLRHIWADESDAFGNPGNCEKDDFVHDTPMANQQSRQNMPCAVSRNSCANENEFSDDYWGALNPPDQIENYMDYSAEDCQNMFSEGQSVRMRGYLESGRDSLVVANINGAYNGDFQAVGFAKITNCENQCNGSINLMAYNGLEPYTYSIDSGATFVSESEFSELCYGIYDVIVKDANGEEKYFPLFVDEIITELALDADAVDATCSTCADGEATVDVLSGNAPYSYEWNTNPVQTEATATNLTPGTYEVTVTDACGNSKVESVDIGSSNSIAELNPELFKVFPNPANDILKVRSVDFKNYQAKLISADGRVLFEGDLNRGIIDINVNHYSEGIYQLILTDGNAKTNITWVKQ